MSKSELEDFILELAEDDEKIERKILLRFSAEDISVQNIKSEIREIINNCSDRYGFIDYYSSYNFESQMSELIKNTFPRLISDKNYSSAFEIICTFFFEFGKLEIDDSNGCLGDLMSSIMEYFSTVIYHMNPDEKDKAFNWVEKHLDDEKIVDYIRSDLFTAYNDFFTNKKYLQRKIEFFDEWLKENYSDEKINDFNYRFEMEKYAENRMACMEKLNCSEEEIIIFCKQFDKIPKISNKLAEIYLSKNQYEETEKVYLKTIEENKKLPGIVDDFKHKLLELYKKTNDIKKQMPLLKEFIFDRMDVNLNFYRDYKALFSESEWKKELDSILKMSRYSSQIEEILFEKKNLRNCLTLFAINIKQKTKDFTLS